MNKLVIQDDEGKTTVVPLIREEITIGRKEGNTIRLTERNVSRRHARILRQNAAVQIEDLDSYNGVRVNGSRIQGRCPLSLSDRVQIGDYLIELKSDEAQAAATDPYGEQRTQPIERVDPMAATPAPLPADRGEPTAVVAIDRVQGTPANGYASVADTDPAAAAPRAVEHPARMVILSANFAGRDHELNKPAMVIGRTDDNDIVINHRSISRHHAKIVRENDRYAIVDLQSSNGVRVNGEDYGKVELRAGDMVDLGHVRMRFVDVGEDFVFGRDAQAIEVAGKGKGMLYAILAVVALGIGLTIFVAGRGGGGEDKTTTAEVAANPGTVPAPNAIDAAAAPAVANGNNAVGEKMAAAHAANDKQNWELAKKLAGEALALDPENAAAQQLVEKAGREIDNAARYRDFMKAADTKDYRQVAKLFNEIENDSVYREEARDTHDGLRDEYVAKVDSKAKEYASTNKCGALRKLKERAGEIWTEAGEAAAAHESSCETRVAVKKPTKPRDPKPKDPKPKDPPPDTSGKSAAELTNEARAAAKSGQFGKAIRLCEQALAKKRGDQDAAMVCVIASCNLKNATKAKRYINKLRSAGRKGMARQICLKQGVKVD